VESHEGKGTVFRFRLPVVDRAEAAPPAPRVDDRREDGLVS